MIQTRPKKEPFQVMELRMGDVLVVDIGIGNMPSGRIKAHVEECRELLKKTFGPGQQMMLLPKREVDGIELSVIRIC